MADLTHLRLERPSDGVALLVLDNPDQRNAMSDEMTRSWVAAVDELAADRSVRAVVVTGEGSAFCSGGDTSWLAGEPDATVDSLRTRMLAFYRAWLSIRRLEVPTIAAINGPAIGAGLCVALACDLRHAAAGAKMGVPFVKLGLHPGMAGTYLLPDAVGPAAARDLMLTGRLVDADEALRLGLVSRVVDARGVPRRRAGHRRRDRRHRADRQPPHQARARRERAPRPRELPAVGGDGAADHAGHRRPPGGAARRPREAPPGVHRRVRAARAEVRPRSGRRRGPHPASRRLPSPCERRSAGRGPRLVVTLGTAREAGQRCGPANPPRLWTTLWTNLWRNGAAPVQEPGENRGCGCGGHARPGRRPDR